MYVCMYVHCVMCVPSRVLLVVNYIMEGGGGLRLAYILHGGREREIERERERERVRENGVCVCVC